MAKAARRAEAADDDSAEQAMLAAAIADTETEIFDEAMGDQPLENDGDRSLEAMGDELGDPEDEPEDSAEGDFVDPEEMEEVDPDEPIEGDEEPGEPPPPPPGETPGGDARMLPSWLRPAEPPPAVPAEVAELRERLARLEGTQRADPAPQPTGDLPDYLMDPVAYNEAIIGRARAQVMAEVRHDNAVNRLRDNFESLEAAYNGEGRVDEFRHASAALDRMATSARAGNRGDAAIVQSIINARDPATALMEWAEDGLNLSAFRASRSGQVIEQAARLLGVDPAALEALAPAGDTGARRGNAGRGRNAQQADDGMGEQRPAAQQRQQNGRRSLPSLNSAGGISREGGNSRTGADPRGFDGSESAIFNYVFDS